MKPLRSSALILFLIAFGLFMAQQGTPLARSPGEAAGPTLVIAAADTTDSAGGQAAGKKSPGLVNPQSVFFGCATGVVIGALATALPPMIGWTFYAGALPAVVAMIATSGVGCAVGLFGGVIFSTFAWIFATVGSAWHAVFG